MGGLSRTQLRPARSVTAACNFAGLWYFYARCATNGATALRRNSFRSRLPAVGTVWLPEIIQPCPTSRVHSRTRDLEHGYFFFQGPLSQQSLFIGPHSPAQTSTTAAGLAFERGRLLQFNCNGIQHCHAKLRDFLRHHKVLVACFQETKLSANSSLIEVANYVIIRPDHPHKCEGGLITIVLSSTYHSVLFWVPDGDIL